MTIRAVRAVNYGTMKEYLKGNPSCSIAAQAAHHDRVWIISITGFYDSLSCPELIRQDKEDRIALQFDDVEDSYDDYTGITKPRDPDFTYFDESMARKVCEFIKRAHESNAESNDLLVVNCHMGISRSGAVSDFVRIVCGLDYNTWKHMNSGVNPNLLVKSLLRWTWEELNKAPPIPRFKTMEARDTLESLALELAQAAGESDWRGPGIQRDIDATSNGWIRWSSVVGWPLPLAERIDKFISEQQALKKEEGNK